MASVEVEQFLPQPPGQRPGQRGGETPGRGQPGPVATGRAGSVIQSDHEPT